MERKIQFLKDSFLFSNIGEESRSLLLGGMEFTTQSYKRGETIYAPGNYETKIGFVVAGKAEVTRVKSPNSGISLNILSVGDSFGILAALSACESFPTTVKARTACEILFISQAQLLFLIKHSSEVAMNVISFLSNRITFLNMKIETFSADSVEQKLAGFLLLENQCKGSTFSLNCKKCAEAINSGRASVYRVLETFKEQGLIRIENKKIYIIDREGLERTKK